MGKDFKDNKSFSNKNKDSYKDKKEKKETIFEFSGYIDKRLIIHFSGGREIVGTLKGYDQVANLVMDDVFEIFRDPNDPTKELKKRDLGLIIVRGPNILSFFPETGYFEIPKDN